MNFDVITIGSAVRDVFMISEAFVSIKSTKFDTGVGECVALGSKIEVDQIVFSTGGGATNAAASLSSLGLRTATIARIGDDSSGMEVLKDLKRFGVNTKQVRIIKDGQTGFSALLTMKDGERTAVFHRGVSKTFSEKDINLKSFKRAKWIYLTSLGGNLKLAKTIIDAAEKTKTKIAWNPGSKELACGIKRCAPLFARADLLNMNTEEAALLTGETKIKKMFEVLNQESKIRIITDGTKGAYVSHESEVWHASTTGAKSISRTGAGDAFGAGFLASFIQSNDLRHALAVGTLNAESVIQKHGAKNGILKSMPSDAKIKNIKIKKV